MTADDKTQRQLLIIGVTCGTLAAAAWAGGFVIAKHGVQIGFSPADIAFHRFFWSGLFLLPAFLSQGTRDLGGIGWGRGVMLSLFGGPAQALLAYSGFILVPLGHGTTIQPACAALFGLIFAGTILRERISPKRLLGAAAIIVGLLFYGVESLATIGGHGVGGDLLFVCAGAFWAMFGTLLRRWHIVATSAVVAVGAISMLLMAPIYLLLYGWSELVRHGFWENALQAVVQGGLAGILPIYLFAHAVFALGAGRAATFPSLVPIFGMAIGFLSLGVVPSLPQIAGLVIVLIGFQFTLGR